jgi:hypothetical protein
LNTRVTSCRASISPALIHVHTRSHSQVARTAAASGTSCPSVRSSSRSSGSSARSCAPATNPCRASMRAIDAFKFTSADPHAQKTRKHMHTYI